MKKLFFLLLIMAFAFAEFKLQNMEVSVTINEDGSANIEERINLIAFGQYSMQLYESGYNHNTLSGWQETTNLSEIKTHISARNADIRNMLIRPQPLQKSTSGLDIWYGQILMDYQAYPYYGKDGVQVNGTGIVAMEKYKPRTTRYTLNEAAFNLPRTDTGDIRLDDITTLVIDPPQTAVMTYLNPITDDLHDSKFPVPARALKWSGLTLVQFSLTYEVEQTLDKEVVEFFSDFQQSVRSSMFSQEGFAAIVVAVLLVFAYFYLKLSRR